VNKYVTFGLSAVAVLGGAALTLDWSSIVSQQTAGVVAMILGGAIAVAKALYTPAPTKAKGE